MRSAEKHQDCHSKGITCALVRLKATRLLSVQLLNAGDVVSIGSML